MAEGLGNRGKCAQPCRLPYLLINENNSIIDKGYLLSTRDLCGLEFIPQLIKYGVSCFKIEGRMKSPEYVAIVTRIYRKYIDLAYSNKPYIIDENDKKTLLLAFNRGGFSSGHFNSYKNKNLVFKEKPNNMGLFLGKIKKYDNKKGLITLSSNEVLNIGDSISVEKEDGTYKISELMQNGKNLKASTPNTTITIGRMKGNINVGDSVFKISDSNLTKSLKETFKENTEIKKINLNCDVVIKEDNPVELTITQNNSYEIYNNLNINVKSSIFPEKAKNSSITKDSVKKQLLKTQNTPYTFTNINIEMADNLFLPNSVLNELKRSAISKVQNFALNNISRTPCNINYELNSSNDIYDNTDISVLLNILDLNKNYSELKNINNIYIPLKYFLDKKYFNIINYFADNFNLFVYLPTIMRKNYTKLFYKNLDYIINNISIKGFVISNIGGLIIIKYIKNNYDKDFSYVGNYTLNIFNCNTSNNLLNLGLDKVTLSCELDYSSILNLCNTTNNTELIVYGNTPLMNINYCPFGKTNLCLNRCKNAYCESSSKLYLKDRMNYNFRIIPDNIDTISTIYNSKITSINYEDFNISSVRIDILDEDVSKINKIIDVVKNKGKLEGKDYTNGNLNRQI